MLSPALHMYERFPNGPSQVDTAMNFTLWLFEVVHETFSLSLK